MNRTVLWMRHGTCDDGLCRPEAHPFPDSPLTVAGVIEAELAARQLHRSRLRPTAIASSPLRRARQTANIVARILDVRLLHADPVFAEWRAPHCVLGRSPDQYPPAYLTWRANRAHDTTSALPGGESLAAFAERAERAAATALELATTASPVLVVSHRLLIGAVAATMLCRADPAEHFDKACRFRLAPAHMWLQREEHDR